MIIDCISDLHGYYPDLEGGDLLIVAGDLTSDDSYEELDYFERWLKIQDYKLKIVIAGNHDNHIEANPNWLASEKICYLQDSGIEFTYEEDDYELEMCGIHPSIEKTLKIWGSPWTKTFPGMNPRCKAFTVDTEEELGEKWALIPDDIDILVTHSPPYGILDFVPFPFHLMMCGGDHVGSKSLQMELYIRLKPKLLVCGHIHEAYGIELPGGIVERAINASHVNERYEPVNKPIRVII